MKRHRLLLLIGLIVFIACDSGTSHKRETVRVEKAQAPAGVEEDRVRVPGSKIALKMEGDFGLNRKTRILISEGDTNAFMTVSELLWSFKDMRGSVQNMDFGGMGMKANSVKDTMIAGRQAIEVIGTQVREDGARFGKFAYILKMDTGTVLVLGNYPAARPELLLVMQRMVGSLKVVAVDALVLIDELEFGVDTLGTGFKYSLNQRGGREFTLIPHDLPLRGMEPDGYFWVIEIAVSPMDLKARRNYFQSEMSGQCRRYGADPVRIKDVTVGGMPGFQAECLGPGKEGRPEVLLITQLYGHNAVYLLMGRTNYDHKAMLPRFKELVERFRWRKRG